MPRKICPIPGCPNPVASRVCASHLWRQQHGLDMTKPLAPHTSQKGKSCVNHPGRPARATGLCHACLVKKYREGKTRIRRYDEVLGKSVDLWVAEDESVLGELLRDLPKKAPEPEAEPRPKRRQALALPGVGRFPSAPTKID